MHIRVDESASNTLLTVNFTQITNSVPTNKVQPESYAGHIEVQERRRNSSCGNEWRSISVWDEENASEGALYPCKVETSLKTVAPGFISRRIMLSSSHVVS